MIQIFSAGRDGPTKGSTRGPREPNKVDVKSQIRKQSKYRKIKKETKSFQDEESQQVTRTSSTDTVCLRVLGLPWPISRSISKLHLWYIGYECIKALLTLWIPNDIKESLIPQPLIMLIRRPTFRPHQRSCCRWWEGTRALLGSHWHMPWVVDT